MGTCHAAAAVLQRFYLPTTLLLTHVPQVRLSSSASRSLLCKKPIATKRASLKRYMDVQAEVTHAAYRPAPVSFAIMPISHARSHKPASPPHQAAKHRNKRGSCAVSKRGRADRAVRPRIYVAWVQSAISNVIIMAEKRMRSRHLLSLAICILQSAKQACPTVLTDHATPSKPVKPWQMQCSPHILAHVPLLASDHKPSPALSILCSHQQVLPFSLISVNGTMPRNKYSSGSCEHLAMVAPTPAAAKRLAVKLRQNS